MTQQAQTKTQENAQQAQPVPGGATMAKAERTVRGTLGGFADPKEVNRRLQWLSDASNQAHLVTPSTSVATLPPGTSVALSMVQVDIENETYKTGGWHKEHGEARGLSKSALDKLAAAAGISWDPFLSRRLDDGRDPCFCSWQAVGRMRQLDGVELMIMGTVELDLREGSPTVAALASRAKDGKSAEKQLRDMRMYITRHAETKCRLRAIRSVGIRTSYYVGELQKPFVVARLMWTGETNDPELKRIFAEKTADMFLGARSAMYGGPTHVALPAPVPAPPMMAALTADEIGFDDTNDSPAEPKSDPNAARAANPTAAEEKL